MAYDNRQAFINGVNDYANRVILPRIKMVMQFTASELESLKSKTNLPIFTGNLDDSTGAAVYAKGMMIAFVPPQKATKPQNGYYGIDLIRQAISDAATQYATGCHLVLFSTMPYAYYIETKGSPIGRGQEYFTQLSQYLADEITRQVKGKNLWK